MVTHMKSNNAFNNIDYVPGREKGVSFLLFFGGGGGETLRFHEQKP
jgi:hypothetical protein